MSETQERDWVTEVGAGAYSSIADMVAALKCDYERLEDLKKARDDFEPEGEVCPNCKAEAEWAKTLTVGERECKHCTAIQVWADANTDDAEELKELEGQADDCESEEQARERIEEDPLSIEVRSDWVTVGEEMTAGEFNILLSTGGPASRIMGELDDNREPRRAWLEVQDWFKPWTQYFPADQDVLLEYARCFTYTY